MCMGSGEELPVVHKTMRDDSKNDSVLAEVITNEAGSIEL